VEGRRWEGDARGLGIASGAPFAAGVAELADAMQGDGWVAEEAEAHLLPHIERACSDGGVPLGVAGAEACDDGVFVVTLHWHTNAPRFDALRRAVFAVVGAFSESSTFVRQRLADGEIWFDVTTGMMSSQTRFAPHGHLVRLRVTGEAAAEACRRYRAFLAGGGAPVDRAGG
jgi:hypothetical protein